MKRVVIFNYSNRNWLCPKQHERVPSVAAAHVERAEALVATGRHFLDQREHEHARLELFKSLPFSLHAVAPSTELELQPSTELELQLNRPIVRLRICSLLASRAATTPARPLRTTANGVTPLLPMISRTLTPRSINVRMATVLLDVNPHNSPRSTIPVTHRPRAASTRNAHRHRDNKPMQC
jgi:hypothetical protein